MSGNIFDTFVIGDGVITIPVPVMEPQQKEGDPMATDLPDNVAQANMTLIASNVTQGTNRINGVFDAAMGAIAGTVQTNFSEVGTLEGRAVSGVNATPIAGPSNGQKAS